MRMRRYESGASVDLGPGMGVEVTVDVVLGFHDLSLRDVDVRLYTSRIPPQLSIRERFWI